MAIYVLVILSIMLLLGLIGIFTEKSEDTKVGIILFCLIVVIAIIFQSIIIYNLN